MKKIIIPLSIFLLTLLINSNVLAVEFNPNYIIADEDILDTSDMTLAEVQRFLASKGGYLNNYIVDVNVINEPFRQMPAADFIYERAIQNGVNPKFILVLLQKEQSLITETNPDIRSLNFATGYGCPDNGTCSDRWLGFAKQVNSATLQFKDYIDNPQSYRYQVGQVYTFNDNRANIGLTTTVVTPLTKATAGLYNYTPHVYNGNYNFWKLWNEWFSFSYPDGSVLQAKNDPVVYLITNGQKRPFKSKAALLSRYPLNRIIQVDHLILDQFPLGETIKYPQYALYRSPQGTVYMIIDDVKHGFTSREVMKVLGVNPEEIENLSQAAIDEIPEGSHITIDSSYPKGALLKSKESGTVYYVKDGQKYPIVHPDIITVNFGNKPLITAVTSDELRKYVAMPPLYLNSGVLVTSNDPLKRAVYVISDGLKRPIVSGEVFTSLGYKWENIYSINDEILQMHPTGDPLDIIN
jgi:hypothetical protein